MTSYAFKKTTGADTVEYSTHPKIKNMKLVIERPYNKYGRQFSSGKI